MSLIFETYRTVYICFIVLVKVVFIEMHLFTKELCMLIAKIHMVWDKFFYGWASFIPDPKTSLYHRQIRYMMISLTHMTSISYMTIKLSAFVVGLGS